MSVHVVTYLGELICCFAKREDAAKYVSSKNNERSQEDALYVYTTLPVTE